MASGSMVTPNRGPDRLATVGRGGGGITFCAAAGGAKTINNIERVAVRMKSSICGWCTRRRGDVLIAVLKCSECRGGTLVPPKASDRPRAEAGQRRLPLARRGADIEQRLHRQQPGRVRRRGRR